MFGSFLEMSSTSEYKTYNEVQEMKKKITSAENHIADYDKYQEHKAVKNLTCPRGFTLKTSECQGRKCN